MRSRRNPSKSFILLEDRSSELSLNTYPTHSSTSPLTQKSTTGDRKYKAKILMILPLAIHFLGSVAIAITLLYYLDNRQFYLERQPRIKLADGTYEVNQLGKYNLLQSDITTIVSGLLMALRWIAAAWAGPLCWHVVFLLAEKNGLQYRDIKWVANYGVLPPATHFRRPLNLLLGLILIFTLAPFPVSPLLTGSISWIPSSSTVELSHHPSIQLTGVYPNISSSLNRIDYSAEYHATFSTDVVKNFNTAWDQTLETSVFKRVIPSVSHLSINSTVESAIVPYFAVGKIEWLPNIENETLQLFQNMLQDRTNFVRLPGKMSQPGAAALIVKYMSIEGSSSIILDPPSNWSIIVNVAKELDPQGCSSSATFLSNGSTISPFYLAQNSTPGYVYEGKFSGCFVHARVSYRAASGRCSNCRITSPSTVQNDTELKDLGPEEGDPSINRALADMPQHIPTVTPLKNSLPDLADGIDPYIIALLTRLYSALWTSWSDAYGFVRMQSSSYKPALSTLKADINKTRVYAWLLLQMSATFAGLGFLALQQTSDHPLLSDTSMVAFDIDSTRVPKSDPSKHEREEILKIEPKEDGWRVVLASSRSINDSE